MIKEWLQKQKAKSDLKRAFDAGKLYVPYKMSGGNEIRRYAHVHDVVIKQGYTRYVFSPPIGLDPKEIVKKEYAFKQVLGQNVDIKNKQGVYILTNYVSSMPTEVMFDSSYVKSAVGGYKLPIFCGYNRYNQAVVYDMRDIPHLLIGGATGYGKSTQLRQILTTLILTKKPEELELYLADCKKSEFHVFRDVDHVKSCVVKEDDVKTMTDYLVSEMDKRSDLLDVFRVAHIDDLPKEHKKPYSILCIDEVVKLRENKEIKKALIDLTSLGRALGIFVILSMQRPTANVIDTTIRASLNVAMGFKVRDRIESRVLNTPGAEELTTKGRFYMDVNGTMSEIQAPYLELKAAEKLLEPFIVMKNDVKEVYSEPLKDEKGRELLEYSEIFGEDEQNEETR